MCADIYMQHTTHTTFTFSQHTTHNTTQHTTQHTTHNTTLTQAGPRTQHTAHTTQHLLKQVLEPLYIHLAVYIQLTQTSFIIILFNLCCDNYHGDDCNDYNDDGDDGIDNDGKICMCNWIRMTKVCTRGNSPLHMCTTIHPTTPNHMFSITQHPLSYLPN